jgi:hypothetical protein
MDLVARQVDGQGKRWLLRLGLATHLLLSLARAILRRLRLGLHFGVGRGTDDPVICFRAGGGLEIRWIW